MTEAQLARLQGFNASLAQRGVLVTLLPDEEVMFDVLVEPIPASGVQFQGEREMSRIHVRRSDFHNKGIKPGHVFNQYDTDNTIVANHRVIGIEDNRASILVILTCETCEGEE